MNCCGFANETWICQVSESRDEVRFEIGVVTLDALLVANHSKFITGNLSRTVLHILVFGTSCSQAQIVVPVGPCIPLIFQDLQKSKKNLELGVFETPSKTHPMHTSVDMCNAYFRLNFVFLDSNVDQKIANSLRKTEYRAQTDESQSQAVY